MATIHIDLLAGSAQGDIATAPSVTMHEQYHQSYLAINAFFATQ
jgi:hypothetical protein